MPSGEARRIAQSAVVAVFSPQSLLKAEHGIEDSPHRPLERHDFSLARHPALGYWLRMIFSENRSLAIVVTIARPLFGIMR